jgi:hypothetical protein
LPVQWYFALRKVNVSDFMNTASLMKFVVVFLIFSSPVLYLLFSSKFAPGLMVVLRRKSVALMVFGIGLSAITAGLISTSKVLQSPMLPIGLAWRDSSLVTPAISIFSIGATVGVLSLFRGSDACLKSFTLRVLPVVFVLISFIVTWSVTKEASLDAERLLNNRIASEAVVFAETDQSNEIRCDLLTEWNVSYRDKKWDFRPNQLRWALDKFVGYAHGAPYFCEER